MVNLIHLPTQTMDPACRPAIPAIALPFPDLFVMLEGAPFVGGDADPSTKGAPELIMSLICFEDDTCFSRSARR